MPKEIPTIERPSGLINRELVLAVMDKALNEIAISPATLKEVIQVLRDYTT